MIKCGIKDPSNIKRVDAIEEMTDSLSKVMIYVNNPIKTLNGLDPSSAVNDSDAIIKALTNDDKATVASVMKRDSRSKALILTALDNVAKEVYRAIDSPTRVLESIDKKTRLYRVLVQSSKLAKIDVSLEKMYHGFLKALNINPKSAWSDLFGVRLNKFEQWEPSRTVFSLHQQIQEYVDKEVRMLGDKVRKEVVDFSNSTVLKEAEIDTVDKISQLAVFFDKGRQREYMENIGLNDRKQAFNEFAMSRDISIPTDKLEEVYDEFSAFATRYQAINGQAVYTNGKFDGRATLEQAGKGTVLEFIRNTRNKVKEMYEMITPEVRRNMKQSDVESFERIHKLLDNFVARENYIPWLGDNEDPFSMMFKSIGDNDSISISAWLKRRRELVDIKDFNEGDLLSSLSTNLSGTAVLIHDFSNKFFASYLKSQMELQKDWFKGSSERSVVKTHIEQAIHIAERISNENHDFYSMKNFLSITSIVPAGILMLPGSAMKNTLAGLVNMYQRMGSEIAGKDYHNALISGEDVAIQVKDYTDKWLQSVGIIGEFVQNKEEFIDSDYAKSSKSIRDSAMMTADFLGEGMGLGKIFKFYHDFFTVKGTEEQLRAHIANVLYNRVKADMIVQNGKGNLSELITKHSEQAFYDVNNALGNYSPLNKPFLTHALAESPETVTQLLTGMAVKWGYMFRHAGFVTAQNFMHSLGSLTMKFTKQTGNPYENKSKELTQFGLVGFGLTMAMYELLKRTFFSEEEKFPKFNFSAMTAVNPMEEIDVSAKWLAYLTMGSMTNMKMSEKDYDALKQETLQYATGLWTSGSSKYAVTGTPVVSALEYYGDTLFNFGQAFLALTDVKGNDTDKTGTSAVYELRGKENAVKAKIGSFMSFDPIYLVEKLTALTTFDAPNDVAAEQKFEGEILAYMALTMFALNVWSERNPKPSTFSYDDEYTSNKANTYLSVGTKLGKKGYYANKSLADRAVANYLKYGSGRLVGQRGKK